MGDAPVGTVWVVAHKPLLHFDTEDVRIITTLTRFASAAVEILHRLEVAEATKRSLLESENRFRALVTARLPARDYSAC